MSHIKFPYIWDPLMVLGNFYSVWGCVVHFDIWHYFVFSQIFIFYEELSLIFIFLKKQDIFSFTLSTIFNVFQLLFLLILFSYILVNFVLSSQMNKISCVLKTFRDKYFHIPRSFVCDSLFYTSPLMSHYLRAISL